MKKVSFHTLACKLNFSETSEIGRLFTEKGFVTVTLAQRPHVFVLNTCSVTENADHKCAKIVKEALKMAPKAFVIVIGCYAQLKPEEIAAIPGVDAVFGTHENLNCCIGLLTGIKNDRMNGVRYKLPPLKKN